MRLLRRSVVLVMMALFGLTAPLALGAAHDGVRMDDQITVHGKKLVLNGMGTREATIFNIRVYVAGLYLQSASHDPAKILSSKETKKLVMLFTRGVGAGKIREAFREGFRKNCAPDCAALEADLSKLVAKMPDMKDHQTMSFVFTANSVEGSIDGHEVVRIENPKFPKPFLAIWLGAEPPNESLKKGLLSIK